MQKGILYETLGVAKDASTDEIKAAYRKLALKFHPDRNRGEDAKENFQAIGRAYEVLANDKKRKNYDTTGSVDYEEGSRDWDEYFRNLYQKVSINSIDEFRASYVGSAEEYEDILASYLKHQGNMLKIIDDIFFTTSKDIPRIEEVINGAISKKIVPKLKDFDKGVSGKQLDKKRKIEEREEKESKELKDDLVKTIQSRSGKSMEEIINRLEEKYSKPPQKKQRTKKK
jgi:DnaJ homolog subfamily C member 9